MIIYTNEGNPLGLQLLMLAKFAKQAVKVQLVNLNGEWNLENVFSQLDTQFSDSFLMQ